MTTWTARTSAEKARARRMIAAGHARIASTALENYIGRRGLVNYEAWEVEPIYHGAVSGRWDENGKLHLRERDNEGKLG